MVGGVEQNALLLTVEGLTNAGNMKVFLGALLITTMTGLAMKRHQLLGSIRPIWSLVANTLLSFMLLIAALEFPPFATCKISSILAISFFVGSAGDNLAGQILPLLDSFKLEELAPLLRKLGSLEKFATKGKGDGEDEKE